MKDLDGCNAEIFVAKDFSKHPAGRFLSDGPFSGERFREETLIPMIQALDAEEVITIHLDGTRGYGSSFLEESFGGLIRKLGVSAIDKIKFISNRKNSYLGYIDCHICCNNSIDENCTGSNKSKV